EPGRPPPLLRAPVEPAEQREPSRLIGTQDGHEQQAQRRAKAAERLQHWQEPIKAAHGHRESGDPREPRRRLGRSPTQGNQQRNERDERKGPQVDPGEGNEVEKTRQDRQRQRDAARDQSSDAGGFGRRGGAGLAAILRPLLRLRALGGGRIVRADRRRGRAHGNGPPTARATLFSTSLTLKGLVM